MLFTKYAQMTAISISCAEKRRRLRVIGIWCRSRGGSVYLCSVLVMAYELGRDVLGASQLVGDLQASEAGLRENEERMSLAVDAASFGIWIRDLARNEIWASDKWRELSGFAPSERLETRCHSAECTLTIAKASDRRWGRRSRAKADTRRNSR